MELYSRGRWATNYGRTKMPSDPDQDYDEGCALEAEANEYWSRRSDPGEQYCRECDRFAEECKCESEEE